MWHSPAGILGSHARRFDEHGEGSLADWPRTPHRAPTATPAAVVSQVLYLQQNYHFGAGLIAACLQRFN